MTEYPHQIAKIRSCIDGALVFKIGRADKKDFDLKGFIESHATAISAILDMHKVTVIVGGYIADPNCALRFCSQLCENSAFAKVAFCKITRTVMENFIRYYVQATLVLRYCNLAISPTVPNTCSKYGKRKKL